MNKVGETFHQFDPIGVTGMILLSESHISVHTWPEHGSVALDVFCCTSEYKAQTATRKIVDALKPQEVDIKKVSR